MDEKNESWVCAQYEDVQFSRIEYKNSAILRYLPLHKTTYDMC